MTQVNTSMNFLPEDYVEKRQAARAAVLFIGLLLAVVGGVVGTYIYGQRQLKPIIKEHDEVNARCEDESKKIAEVQELGKQKEKMVEKTGMVQTLMERVSRFMLLSELTRLRPKGVNFVSLELKSKDLATAQPSRPTSELEKVKLQASGEAVKPPQLEVTINLVATAPADSEVSAYMGALQKSPLFRGVTLLFSEELKKDKDEAAVRKFNLEMQVNPEMDLRTSESVVNAESKF